MSGNSDTYGFMGTLDGNDLTVADGMGGGRQFNADDDRIVLIDEIADYVRDTAREIAEAIVDDLLDDEDEDDD